MKKKGALFGNRYGARIIIQILKFGEKKQRKKWIFFLIYCLLN